MKRPGPRGMAEVLGTGNLSRLSAEAETRRDLAAEVRSALPEPDASHVTGAHIDEAGRLVVAVDSGAWAARLRYGNPELLGRRLRVQVAVPGREPPG